MTKLLQSQGYIGDFLSDVLVDKLHYVWIDINDTDGASLEPTSFSDININVRKGDTYGPNAGAYTLEDFKGGGIAGLGRIKIDLTSKEFYIVGENYNVYVEAVTIDGETVNTPLFSFSIENRV